MSILKSTISIAICDDDLVIAEHVKSKCDSFFSQKFECSISIFHDGKEIIDLPNSFDIYILDIEMPKMNGLDLAKHISEKYSKATIIFLTGYDDYMKFGYRVNAFRFLTKPINDIDFYEAMNAFIKKKNKEKKFLVRSDRSTHMVYESDILFLESLGDNLAIVLQDEIIVCSDSLKYWKGLVDEFSFTQISRTHIINLNYISEFESQKVILKNGICFDVSRRRYKELVTNFKRYAFENAEYLGGTQSG